MQPWSGLLVYKEKLNRMNFKAASNRCHEIESGEASGGELCTVMPQMNALIVVVKSTLHCGSFEGRSFSALIDLSTMVLVSSTCSEIKRGQTGDAYQNCDQCFVELLCILIIGNKKRKREV